jgi:RNA polymerase sigma factor (sigma-70 family)
MVPAMDDRALVAAIREGNSSGLAGAYDSYADALFSFCVSMLHDRASAEDAVQDTFIVLAQRVGQLRDATRLRPWLYAVARSQCLRQLRSARRTAPLETWEETVSAEPADFDAGVHGEQLQALVWQAMGGLNTGERAALELSLRHGLEGDDLAAALDVTRANANKLLERSRAELERSLAALLVARDPSRCPELAEIVTGWDGVMTPLMRKRLARHIDRCPECGEQKKRRVSAAALLTLIPLLAAPVALRSRAVGGFRLVSDDSALGPRERTAVGNIAGYDAAGFPSTRPRRRRRRAGGLVAAATVAAVAAGAFMLHSGDSPDTRPAAALATRVSAPTTAAGTSATPTPTAPQPTHSSRQRSRTSHRTPTAPGAHPSPAGSATSSTVPPATPTPAPHPRTPTPRRRARHAPSPTPPAPSPRPTRTTPTPTPTTPAPAVITATPKPSTYSAADGGSGVLILSLTGPAVDWTSTATNGVVVSPATGTIPAGGTTHPKLIVPRSKPGASATITITWSTGSTTATITWT